LSGSPGLRGALARALLLILAATQVASFPFREFPVWLSLRAHSSRESPAQDVPFWFDPGYAPFLRAVRQWPRRSQRRLTPFFGNLLGFARMRPPVEGP
jgi:hypothetical protein